MPTENPNHPQYRNRTHHAIGDFFDDSHVIVGTVAKKRRGRAGKDVDFVKREMGKPKDQFHREFSDKIYSAEELSALIIKKLKADARSISISRSPTQSLPCRLTSMMPSAHRDDHGGQLAGLTSSRSSMNRPQPRSPTGSISWTRTRRCSFSTSRAALST